MYFENDKNSVACGKVLFETYVENEELCIVQLLKVSANCFSDFHKLNNAMKIEFRQKTLTPDFIVKALVISSQFNGNWQSFTLIVKYVAECK